MNKKKIAFAFAAAALAVTAAGGSIAFADPAGPPQYRPLSGVGSDTTQDVMNGLAAAITVNGQKVIGSYDATGSANVTTKDPAVNANCTMARPNGSGAGRAALLTSSRRATAVWTSPAPPP